MLVTAYHVWMATEAVATRFTSPARQGLPTGNLPIRAELGESAIAVTNDSDVIWNCLLIVAGPGITVTRPIEIAPMQTQSVPYGAFATRENGLTSRQVGAFARKALSATCKDRQGTVRVGNLR